MTKIKGLQATRTQTEWK